MFKLLIEIRNDNKKIYNNPDLEIVTVLKKGAINALNDIMFLIATHSVCYFHLSQNISKNFEVLVSFHGILMIQNLIY